MAQRVRFSAALRAERDKEGEGGREKKGLKPTDRAGESERERERRTDCVNIWKYTDLTVVHLASFFLQFYPRLILIPAPASALAKPLPDSIEGPSGAAGSLLASAPELEAALEWDGTAGRSLPSLAARF